MLDNNIELTTNNYQKINQTLDRVLHTTFQHHAVESNTKISQHKLPVVFIPPSKPRAYTVLALLSQQNRRLKSSDRSRSKKNVSYQTKKQTNRLLKPAPTLHITKKI